MINRRHLYTGGLVIGLGAVCGAGAARILSGRGVSAAATTAAIRVQTTVTTTHAPAVRVTTAATVSTQSWLDTKALRAAVAGIQVASGPAGVAVRPLSGDTVFVTGGLLTGAAWSTIKVPIVMARYRLAATSHETDQSAIDALADTAITESDNAAAAALFEQIGAVKGGVVGASRYVQTELVAAGDASTVVNTVESDPPWSTYGQTNWSLARGTLFYRQLALGCLTPHAATTRIVALMRDITSSQRWGAGAVSWGPATVAFKGGWGPDTSGRYLVRQFAIVQAAGGRGFIVGLLSKPSGGGFDSGTAVLTRLAAAVTAATRIARSPVGHTCA